MSEGPLAKIGLRNNPTASETEMEKEKEREINCLAISNKILV